MPENTTERPCTAAPSTAERAEASTAQEGAAVPAKPTAAHGGADGWKPLLTSTDWNEEWKRLQRTRRAADDPAYWDGRAHTFPADTEVSPYAQRFLDLAAIRPGETVFDMGCGTGALSLPLGLAGHKVVAADFSAGMLSRMQEVLDARGVRTVFPKQMSWDEDWAAHGVRTGMTDIALASRSIATADLRDSLLRLTDIARRRVCVTLTTGSSPRTDERILAAIGLEDALCRDYLYALNILAAEGLRPTLDYIESARYDTFASPADALEVLGRMVDGAAGAVAGDEARAAAMGRLRAWLDDNLVPNEHAGEPDRHGTPQGPLRLREPRVITWAFIAWDK